MADVCSCCGKKIPFLDMDFDYIEIDNESYKICGKCKSKINAYNSGDTSVDEIISDSTHKVIADYIRNIKSEVPLKKCPVCKKNVNYDIEICSNCGYAFNVVSAIEYNEIAKIYNERLEQYKKNPFYEYDYIVVSNKADGSTNKETIKDIIESHAMQGWRLVTMYSNEIGKNAVTVGGVGGNVTICEDVLVFERCIKSEER